MGTCELSGTRQSLGAGRLLVHLSVCFGWTVLKMPTQLECGEQGAVGFRAMKNATHQTIFDSLPPRRRRSKLEPYAALIRALRARGRSYREIVAILRDRCGLQVATHTVFHFVRGRAQQTGCPRPRRRQLPAGMRCPAPTGPAPVSPSPGSEDVWARIVAAKRRAPASTAEPKAFAYDGTEPLQLMPNQPPRER